MNRPPLPPPRARQPSVDEIVERLEDAFETRTSPGVGRRMNSERVREIVRTFQLEQELKVRTVAEEKRARLHDQILVGVVVGLALMIVTSVVSYLAGHAASAPQASPPAAAAHP